MATVKFLTRTKAEKLATIYIKYVDGVNTNILLATPKKIYPSFWDQKRQAITKNIIGCGELTGEQAEDIQDELMRLKSKIARERFKLNASPTREWLSSIISSFFNTQIDNTKTFNGYIANFITKAEAGEIKNKAGVNFAKGTLTNFKGFQRAFNEYQGEYSDERKAEFKKKEKPLRKKRIIDFEDITIDFYNSFVAYLSNEGYEINTMDKFIGTLKYFMEKSLVEKKHHNREFKESAFAGLSEDSHAIYLTIDEVQKIYNHKLTGQKEKSRDAFIVLCETALRVSDYKRVDVSVKGKFIDIHNQKTGMRVIIPLTTRMKEILKKYNGQLPRIADQHINDDIKVIAEEVGLTEKITWPAQKFGKKFTDEAKKCELVTCHTGRRTACTNMYKAGIPVIDIMKISGHRTEKSFLKYIRLSQEETAERLSIHPYFNDSLKIAN